MARTAKEPDFFRTAELQPLLCTVPDADELPNNCNIYTAQAHCDKFAPGSQTGAPKLLGLCQQISLLVLDGRTPGNEYGQCTFQFALD